MVAIFSWFDIISIVLILMLGIKGIINGVIKEIFGLVGIVGGIFIASRYANDFGVFIDQNLTSIHNQTSIYLVGFVSILFLAWFLCLLIGFILTKIISFSPASIINKILGFIVSCLKIFMVFSILMTALTHIDFIKTNFFDKYISNSPVYNSFLTAGELIINMNISDIEDSIEVFSNNTFDNFVEEVKDEEHEENWQY